MKYTKETCPKKEQWFLDGGRCGWAHECDYCEEMNSHDKPIEIPIKQKKRFKIQRAT